MAVRHTTTLEDPATTTRNAHLAANIRTRIQTEHRDVLVNILSEKLARRPSALATAHRVLRDEVVKLLNEVESLVHLHN